MLCLESSTRIGGQQQQQQPLTDIKLFRVKVDSSHRLHGIVLVGVLSEDYWTNRVLSFASAA